MNPLLTAEELAAELKMHPVTVRKWAREKRINAELLIGRSPRFDLKKVRKQLAEATAKRDREKFTGMVPTI